MAPPNHNMLHSRQAGSGNVFSVVFVCIAALVLSSCIMWTCIWPWLLKKQIRPRKLSQTARARVKLQHQKSQEAILTQEFPSHPVALRGFTRHRMARSLHIYDPRIESPFPFHPQPDDLLSIPSLPLHRASSCGPTRPAGSNGLFTPVKERYAANLTHKSPSHALVTTVSQTRAGRNRAQSTASDKSYGDAKEYILAVPEPLALHWKPRNIVSTPVRSIEKRATASSMASDKHPHPKRLFDQVSDFNLESSECCGSNKVVSTNNNVAVQLQEAHGSPITNTNDAGNGLKALSYHQYSAISQVDAASLADVSLSRSALEDPEPHIHNSSLAALHRLRTYRSLTGAKKPPPLTRAGTLTRSKTPVAEIRTMYDRKIERSRHTAKIPILDEATSTNFSTAGIDPEITGFTGLTSADFVASSASLLPNSLRPGPFFTQTFPLFSLNSDRGEMGQLNDTVKHVCEEPAGIRLAQDEQCCIRLSSASEIRDQFRPTKSRLNAEQNLQNSRGNIVRPMLSGFDVAQSSINQKSFRQSSIYSQGTVGLERSPSLEFRKTMQSQACISPCPIDVPRDIFTTIETSRREDHNYQSSTTMTAVRAKVDDWNCHVGEVDWSSSLSSSLKRSLSRFSLDHQIDEVTARLKDDGSAISTEVHSTEANIRMSLPRICIRESLPRTPIELGDDTDLCVLYDRDVLRGIQVASHDSTRNLDRAPGNANWL